MSKQYFIPCKDQKYDRYCDKCGYIYGIGWGHGPGAWNPNPRAKIKHICSDCFLEYELKKVERLRVISEIEEPPAWSGKI